MRDFWDFVDRPRATPSPGPWRVKGPVMEYRPWGTFMVWVVLDANSKCVAECESQVDALLIAQNGPAGA